MNLISVRGLNFMILELLILSQEKKKQEEERRLPLYAPGPEPRKRKSDKPAQDDVGKVIIIDI